MLVISCINTLQFGQHYGSGAAEAPVDSQIDMIT